jgi:hypothetical protein
MGKDNDTSGAALETAVGIGTIGCGLFGIISFLCSLLVPIILVGMVIMAIVRGC